MISVLVLGGSGMLGSMVVDVLSRENDFTVTSTVRQPQLVEPLRSQYPNVRWTLAGLDGDFDWHRLIDGHEWMVNAIGVTKPLIRDDNAVEIENAINVNAQFPHVIARAAGNAGAHILQIATDCVFSGNRGAYREDDPHDALDVYGKTKSLGEAYHAHAHHLRCSIVGLEFKDFKFLVEWFRRQPNGVRLKGFVNHRWNGVTTLHFARLCRGIMRERLKLGHMQHILPAGVVTKAELLHQFGKVFGRPDIHVEDVRADVVVDRTLVTQNPELNENVWRAAGYAIPPTISEMLDELAAFDYRAA